MENIWSKIANKEIVVPDDDRKKQKEYAINEVANILTETRKNNHKIISVGTTTTRTLETIMQKYNEFRKTLFTKVNHDIKKYNEGKINYINNLLEENYKFE